MSNTDRILSYCAGFSLTGATIAGVAIGNALDANSDVGVTLGAIFGFALGGAAAVTAVESMEDPKREGVKPMPCLTGAFTGAVVTFGLIFALERNPMETMSWPVCLTSEVSSATKLLVT